MTDSRYQVRGPCPDGDWFIVEVDGEDEASLDECYATQAAAQMVADRLNGESA